MCLVAPLRNNVAFGLDVIAADEKEQPRYVPDLFALVNAGLLVGPAIAPIGMLARAER
jgi:hypothetical protein